MGQSLGLFISTAVPDVFTAQSISFVIVLVLMLFGEASFFLGSFLPVCLPGSMPPEMDHV